MLNKANIGNKMVRILFYNAAVVNLSLYSGENCFDIIGLYILYILFANSYLSAYYTPKNHFLQIQFL